MGGSRHDVAAFMGDLAYRTFAIGIDADARIRRSRESLASTPTGASPIELQFHETTLGPRLRGDDDGNDDAMPILR